MGVKELISAPIGDQIAQQCCSIFPVKDCYIRKVKVLKKPKFDVTELMEWHNADEAVTTTGDAGTPVAPPEETLRDPVDVCKFLRVKEETNEQKHRIQSIP